MMWTSTIVLGAAAIISSAAAQNTSTPDRQPTVSAPFANPWKLLSEEEVAGVNEVLQQKMSLTGNQGSSQDSYV